MGPKLTADIKKNMNVEIKGLGNSTYIRGVVRTIADFTIIVVCYETETAIPLAGVRVSSSKDGQLLVTDRRNKNYMITILK